MAELITAVDRFVSLAIRAPLRENDLQQTLRQLHDAKERDRSSTYHSQLFLKVLRHLEPLLSPAEILDWFDLVLRPALVSTTVSASSADDAKCLTLAALCKETDDTTSIKAVEHLLRQLFDLYLSAFNGESAADVDEWLTQTPLRRRDEAIWKANLLDLLLTFGFRRPQVFMDAIDSQFVTPNSRRQLLVLFDQYISDPRCETPSLSEADSPIAQAPLRIVAEHNFVVHVLEFLPQESSSILCTIGLTILVKLVPSLAAYVCEKLKDMRPTLLTVLAAMICYRHPEDAPPNEPSTEDEPLDSDDEVDEGSAHLTIPVTEYFTILYYLFPIDVIRFLRSPAKYLHVPTVTWDEDELSVKTETLMRAHVCHPYLIAFDPDNKSFFWEGYDMARIISEANMLVVVNAAQGETARITDLEDEGSYPENRLPISPSLQALLDNTAAAKSPTTSIHSSTPASLVASASPGSSNELATPAFDRRSGPSLQEIGQAHLPTTRTLLALQREILVLRNRLQFETWLSSQNVKNIGRLYVERNVKRGMEREMQGLYNKLRKYRGQVNHLEEELSEHKQQATKTKGKYAEWNTELTAKVKELRESNKRAEADKTELRTKAAEVQTLFEAQGKLLSAATNKAFVLETQIKENQHKLDRLHDYEREIEQHHKMQLLWDADFSKFNEREVEVKELQARIQQMQIRVESYQAAQEGYEKTLRSQRHRIQELEAQSAKLHNKDGSRHDRGIAIIAAERQEFEQVKRHLQQTNDDLREQVEELEHMNELLRGEFQPGLFSPEQTATPALPFSNDITPNEILRDLPSLYSSRDQT
ncbi:hypothetical protein FISHEDRAFT_38402 [Fistulina hepatica ATCC 64428]|nr:hypothetical protein FISHEDRAFT_38402 [Fistulina hepatica ATCC 64428]